MSSSVTSLSPQATFADLIEHLLEQAAPTQRVRNQVSSIKALCKVIGRAPAQIRVSDKAVSDAFSTPSWGVHGLKKARWANIRSDVKRLLQDWVVPASTKTAKVPLSDAWEAIAQQMRSPVQKAMLSRFGRYCSSRQIEPDQVSDELMPDYLVHLTEVEFSKDPRRIAGDTIRLWNGVCDADFTLLRLSHLSTCDTYILPWSAFPASLEVDALAFQAESLKPVFVSSRLRKVRPATAQKRHRQIRQFASAQVKGGVNPSTIRSLEDLASLPNVQKGTEFLLSRNGGEPNQQLFDLLTLMKTIACHWHDGEPDDIATLGTWASKAKPKKHGMTEKNERLIRQLEAPGVMQRYFQWASKEITKALRMPIGYSAAMKLQGAIAIGILQYAPIRLQNLLSLDWDQHLTYRHTQRGRTLFVSFKDKEVKNDVDLELPLPDWLAVAIERYIADYLPTLNTGNGRRCLFPGQKEATKTDSALRSLIKRRMQRDLGLQINPHLFRHLAGFFYLRRHPGDYETVRKLLGHKSLQTTIQFYTGLEAETAIAAYGDLIDDLTNGET